VLFELLAGLDLGLAQPPAELRLNRGVEPHLRQLTEEFALGGADLGHELGRAREALGDFVLLAADVAQCFVERAQRFGSGKAHAATSP
jgi:hypothetical protein